MAGLVRDSSTGSEKLFLLKEGFREQVVHRLAMAMRQRFVRRGSSFLWKFCAQNSAHLV